MNWSSFSNNWAIRFVFYLSYFYFLKIFLTWTICKVFIESVTMLLLLFMFWVFSCEACGVLGLSRWLRGKRICLPVQETQETQDTRLGRESSGVGNGNPLQGSCQENPMDRGGWQSTGHGVAKSQTRLSDWACTHMWNLSFLTRDQTHVSCTGRQILNQGTAREVSTSTFSGSVFIGHTPFKVDLTFTC